MTTSAPYVTALTSKANRKTIAESFGQNQSAVRHIESLTTDTTTTLPDAINTLAQTIVALQNIYYVVTRADPSVPNAEVMTEGAGIQISIADGLVTISLEVPVSVAHGGTGSDTPSGTALDNITGFSGEGLLERTAPGAYDFVPPETFLQAANNLSDVADPVSARGNLGAAESGANSDITSLAGLTTPLAVAEGGTGAASAGGARTNLGLGTIATQNANAVTLTGGSMNGVTVGATTPEPGAFTILAASSNVAFRAQNTSVQSIPTGTATQVTGWTLVSSRNAGGFNATAGTFTAPVAGWYLVSGQLVFAASSIPAGTLYGMWAVVNGVERQRGSVFSEVSNTQPTVVKLPMVALPMAAGDVLTINAVQYSGAALTLDNYGPSQWLSVVQIP